MSLTDLAKATDVNVNVKPRTTTVIVFFKVSTPDSKMVNHLNNALSLVSHIDNFSR
jgi:hypothetical protein